nr:uncharacterized protein LOC104107932 [Nicotiana tomentosiformis]
MPPGPDASCSRSLCRVRAGLTPSGPQLIILLRVRESLSRSRREPQLLLRVCDASVAFAMNKFLAIKNPSSRTRASLRVSKEQNQTLAPAPTNHANLISELNEGSPLLSKSRSSTFRLRDGGVVLQNRAESSLVAEVEENKFSDPYLLKLKKGIHKHKTMAFEQGGDDGTLRYKGRLCVPDVDGLRERIMLEAHNYRYSIHRGSTKMYHDLKEIYLWDDMKKNIADFVAKCPNFQ